jgi:hypothetical protein
LRTDIYFNMRDDPGHHHKEFLFDNVPLELVDFGMVSNILLEPMHLLDLGIVKKILRLIVKNNGYKYFADKTKLSDTETHFLLISVCVCSNGIRTSNQRIS